jgi:hypothetical protein
MAFLYRWIQNRSPLYVAGGVEFVEAQSLGVNTLLARQNGKITLNVFKDLKSIAILTSLRILAFYTH